MPSNAEKNQDALVEALNAVEGCLQTLMMARTIITDRLDEIQQPAEPSTATMTGEDEDCQHDGDLLVKEMFGTVISFCRCGKQM